MNTGKPCINKYLSNVRCSYYQVLKVLGAKKTSQLCLFLRNSTNYPCFNTEVLKKRCFLFKNGLLFPAPPIQCLKSEEIAGSFQHCIGDGGEVRQVKLYSRLPCAQKRRKCKFVPRLLSMIADSRPSRLTVNVPVVSANASNW